MPARILALLLWLAAPLRAETVDVLVYGATPCGIAASVAAAREGRSVTLLEPTRHAGGLVTSGLSHTDFRTFEGITGFYLTFSRMVEAYYRDKYGADSEQVRQCWRGLQAEPHVNELIFERMLAAHPGIRVIKSARVTGVRRTGPRIVAVHYRAESGDAEIAPRLVIDATYEGDLMALAGVPFRVGREGRDEHGEPLAPEEADDQLQAYNFRFIATDDPANRVPIARPAGYRREDFTGVLPFFASGKIQRVFGYPDGCVVKAQLPPLPNRKYDINDVSRGLIRLSMPGHNAAWPAGDAAARAAIFAEHLRYEVGLLYFLQNDAAVPPAVREAARAYGWCRDEFTDNSHLPWQLYVREARRMTGRRVFTERDSDPAPGDARAVLHRDSIAMGDYGNNCHGTAHEGPLYGGRHTGEFYKSVPPYQIPSGTILPNELENLLVPGAPSASHAGFCALRLEPIWSALGEAAGVAAALAVADDAAVQTIAAGHIQARLHRRGAATIYVSDIPPGHALFARVQQLGARGGLHGLHPTPEKPGQRGPKIEGQYYEAFPFHAFEPAKPLEEALYDRWKRLAPDLIVETFRPGLTRGEAFRPEAPEG